MVAKGELSQAGNFRHGHKGVQPFLFIWLALFSLGAFAHPETFFFNTKSLVDRVDLKNLRGVNRNVSSTEWSWVEEKGRPGLSLEARLDGVGAMVCDLGQFFPTLASQLKPGAELKIQLKANPGVKILTLHLQDQAGEWLQTTRLFPTGLPFSDLTWKLDAREIIQNWGAHTNGTIDFPLRKICLAVDGKDQLDFILFQVEYRNPEEPASQTKPGQGGESSLFHQSLHFEGIPAFPVFHPEEKPSWKISWAPGSAPGVSWEWTAIGPWGERKGPYPIDVGGHRIDLALPVNQWGPQHLEITARRGDQPVWKTNFAYSVTRAITWKWQPGDAILGVCTHIERYLDRWSDIKSNAGAEIARLYHHLGFSHDRGELSFWESQQRVAGNFDWVKKDRTYNYLRAQGVRAINLYAYTPFWASTSSNRVATNWLSYYKTPPQPQAYGAYCQAVAARYRDLIDVHELWNEQNSDGFWTGTPEEYVGVAQAARQAIREVDPHHPIVVGGYAETRMDRVRAIVGQTRGNFSEAAFHAYGSFETFVTRWQAFQNIFAQSGYAYSNLIDTETGYFVYEAQAGEKQALALVKNLSYQLSLGLFGVIWYELLDEGSNPINAEHNFGMVTWNHTPKPTFAGYNHLIHQLGGARPLKPVDLTQNFALAQFRQGPDVVAVIWNQRSELTKPVRLMGFPGKAMTLDLYGNPMKEIQSGDTLAVGTVPIWIRVPKASLPLRIESGRLEAEERIANAAGTWTESAVRWKENLTGNTISVTGDRIEAEPKTQTIGPGESSKIFKLRSKSSTIAVEGQYLLTSGSQIMESLPFQMLPVVRLDFWAKQLPTGKFSDFQDLNPVITRQTREHVKELLTFLGESKNEYWGGPSDLSGQLYLFSDPANLIILMKAGDDQHVSPKTAEGMWKADSLQVGIDNLKGQVFEMGVSWPSGSTLFYLWRAPPHLASNPPVQCAATREGSNTFYSLAIPLNWLGLKPGDMFGLSALLNDADRADRKQMLEFGSGIGLTKNPELFFKYALPK